MEVPDGFEPLSGSPFGELVGPFYQSLRESLPVIGLRVAPEHANRLGRAHGGLLTTLADVAMSRAVVTTLPPGATMSTADLHISFLDGVAAGQWLQATPQLERIGRSLVHGSCELTAEDRTVAKVLGCFAVRLG
jgi:acyl-coenzyme A thioesterase 13